METELINEHGDVTNDTTRYCIENVKSIIRQRLDCLADSGATPTELKAVAQNFCEAVNEAADEAILDLNIQVKTMAQEGGSN
jgi:hypothetical protein